MADAHVYKLQQRNTLQKQIKCKTINKTFAKHNYRANT